MTAHAHARRGVLGRLIRRDRTHAPAMPGGYPHPAQPSASQRQQRPPWPTAPQPALTGTGPSGLDALYAQAAERDRQRRAAFERAARHGWDAPPGIPAQFARPYAPEPEPEPVTYPPLSFTADFRELPVFRKVARICGHAPAGRVRVTS